MRQRALMTIAATCLLATTSCGTDPSTRTQLVADACQAEVDTVPAEAEWEVHSGAGFPPYIGVTFEDGGTAEIRTTSDTTVDNLDENLRIDSVTCNVDGKVAADGADDGDDFISSVTWAPDGETFTLDTDEYGDDPVIATELPEQPTEEPEPEYEAPDGPELDAGVDGPIRQFQGDQLSADEVVEYVVTSGMLPEATMANFGCNAGPFVDGDIASCVVDDEPNSFAILAGVHITASGMWITLIQAP